jgi:valyl-tRNA synthetase
VNLLESILKILHPFMPFQTEEIWHWIGERSSPEDALCIASWPTVASIDQELLTNFETFKQLVSEVRNVRKENQIPHRDALVLHVDAGECYPGELQAALSKLCNLSAIEITSEKIPNSFGFLVGRSSFFIPFGDAVDVDAEKAKIQKEIDHTKGFLKAVQGKLSNDRFVSNAPESVVVLERKKESDALSKLAVLNSKLADLE